MNQTVNFNFTSAVLDSRIILNRSGETATRVNGSGYIELVAANTARFNFNPATLTCRGLLIEETKQNGLRYSSDYSNSAWDKTSFPLTMSLSGVLGPDNVTNTYKGVPSASLVAHAFHQLFSFVSGTTYSISVFAKSAGYNFIQVTTGLTDDYINFDLANGIIGNKTSGFVGKIEPYADGFYRCMATIISPITSTQPVRYCVSSTNAAARMPQFIGDTTSGVCFFGTQIENGAEATSYIPTVAAAVTRNADVATITGSNFTGFWNGTQGGATVQATPSTVSGIRPLVQYDDGTSNEIISLRGNTTNPELYIVDGGTPQAQLDAGTIASNTAYSLTGWWATNDCRARKDSGAAVTDATATIPTVTQMRIGSDGTNYMNGTIATINYYAAFSSQIYTRRKNKVVSSLF